MDNNGEKIRETIRELREAKRRVEELRRELRRLLEGSKLSEG